MSNPIQFTSKTFNTILADINSDSELIDTPTWWKRIIAGVGDVLSMYNNAVANQSHLRTAFTRQAVADLLQLIDYYLTPRSTSSGKLLYYLDADAVSFPKTILQADLKALSQGTISQSSLKFEARSGESVSATSEAFTTNFAVDNNLDVVRVYTTGEKVRVATDNTLPAPLQANTDYYVIKISTTEIRLATSILNAYAGTEITLTSDGVGNHTIALYSVQVDSYQQETIDQANIGISDAITEWQSFNLPDINILEDTLVITINSVTWTRVDTLVDSTSTSTHYVLRYNTDESSYIMFGNGTYGKIPGNFSIFADYAIGGGDDSNISTINKINVYTGSDTDIVGVSNPETFAGGDDTESIESAKILGPLLLKARNRFVTVDDGEALALAFGGVERVKVNKNVYGLLSCQVPIVPTGGGLPSSTLKTNLQTDLINRTILESIDVRVIDPTYITVTPVAAIKILSGFTFATVQGYAILGLRLLFSEQTYEFYQDYLQNGIASLVSNINTKWSTSFGISDYPQITTFIENVDPTNFGKDFQESDVVGFIDVYTTGLDYITWTSPSFPITIADDEITTDNVLSGNITQIT